MDNKSEERMFEVLYRLEDRVGSIDKTLAVNTTQLAEHIRRTEILEKELAPVKAHVNRVDGAFKILGVLSALIGIAAAAIKFIR